jgi:hypothetical protein
MVEYNVDQGNMWVPNPLSFGTICKEAEAAGFHGVRLLSTIPSDFLSEIYAAEAFFTR